MGDRRRGLRIWTGAGRQKEDQKSETHGSVGSLRRPPEEGEYSGCGARSEARGRREGGDGRARGKVELRGVPDLELERAGSGEGGSLSGRGGGRRRRAGGGGRREGRAVAAAAPGCVSLTARRR